MTKYDICMFRHLPQNSALMLLPRNMGFKIGVMKVLSFVCLGSGLHSTIAVQLRWFLNLSALPFPHLWEEANAIVPRYFGGA